MKNYKKNKIIIHIFYKIKYNNKIKLNLMKKKNYYKNFTHLKKLDNLDLRAIKLIPNKLYYYNLINF